MKNYILLSLLAILFVGCSFGDMDAMGAGPGDSGGYKDVVYKVDMEDSESGSPYFVKGEYTNERGEMVPVYSPMPFIIEVRRIPHSVQVNFNGYIYCADTKWIIGSMSMVVTEADSDKIISTDKKEYDIYNDTVYTEEEIKENTSFNFLENRGGY